MDFLSALIPVIAIVAFGRFLAWKSVLPPEGFRAIERLCYIVLFPIMIVDVLSRADFGASPWAMVAALVAAQIITSSSGLLAKFWPRSSRPAIGSIIQSNSRWHTMIALSIAGSMFGEPGLALVAIAAAVLIPIANLLSVTALSHFGERPEGAPDRHPIMEMARNPIIIACAIGGLLNVLQMPPSGLIDETLDLLGRCAIGLGLLAAGAGVDLSALKRAGLRTAFWSSWRLILFPTLAGGFALALSTPPMTTAVIVICAATPTATSGYILARELGGDAPLMANLIAVQMVLAAVTMPVLYMLFAGLSAN